VGEQENSGSKEAPVAYIKCRQAGRQGNGAGRAGQAVHRKTIYNATNLTGCAGSGAAAYNFGTGKWQ